MTLNDCVTSTFSFLGDRVIYENSFVALLPSIYDAEHYRIILVEVLDTKLKANISYNLEYITYLFIVLVDF